MKKQHYQLAHILLIVMVCWVIFHSTQQIILLALVSMSFTKLAVGDTP